jgi:ribosomal protection tetracycline resistance protein
VQKEVIQATLADDYAIDAVFREVTPIYIARPIEAGEAVQFLHVDANPYLATIGLRVEPAGEGSGIEFRLDVDTQTVPLYVFKTRESFAEHMEQYVLEALVAGLFGWQVTDCVVTMTQCAYAIPDGPPSRRGRSTSTDFRKLTPLVLKQALEDAGTVVCEPMVRATVELPADTIGAVVPALAKLGSAVETSSLRGDLALVETLVPAARVNDVQRALPGLSRGEGVLESTFAGYRPVVGEQPTRRTRNMSAA